MQDPIIVGCQLMHHLCRLVMLATESKGQENLAAFFGSAMEVLLGQNETHRTPKVWRTEAGCLVWWLEEDAGKELPPLPTAVVKAAVLLLRERAKSETPNISGVLDRFVKEIMNGSSEWFSDITHDSRAWTMVMTFKLSGRERQYWNVPGEVYRALIDAESVGTHYNQNIKRKYANPGSEW